MNNGREAGERDMTAYRGVNRGAPGMGAMGGQGGGRIGFVRWRSVFVGWAALVLVLLSGCAGKERCIGSGEAHKAGGGASVICANAPWNRTGIMLKKGEWYRFAAEGKWKDGPIEASAVGYLDPDDEEKMNAFGGFRRIRDARWFSVIGSIGKRSGIYFDIGALIAGGEAFEAPEDGELYCFANDAHFFYFNNSGTLRLTVTRADGPAPPSP